MICTRTQLPKEEQAVIVAKGEREILEAAKNIRAEKAKAKRAERIEKIVEISKGNTELKTDKSYPVIYADPPWRYEHCETDSRQIENQYPTLHSIGVPPSVLYPAIGQELRISFEAFEIAQ